jgi:hypothetical protein
VAAIDGGAARWAAVSGERRRRGRVGRRRFGAWRTRWKGRRRGKARGAGRQWGAAAMGEAGGRREVRGDPDGWVPLVDDRVREGGVGGPAGLSWADLGELGRAGRQKKRWVAG